MMNAAKVAICREIRTKHNAKRATCKIFNFKPGGT